jgi:hypothetical protein
VLSFRAWLHHENILPMSFGKHVVRFGVETPEICPRLAPSTYGHPGSSVLRQVSDMAKTDMQKNSSYCMQLFRVSCARALPVRRGHVSEQLNGARLRRAWRCFFTLEQVLQNTRPHLQEHHLSCKVEVSLREGISCAECICSWIPRLLCTCTSAMWPRFRRATVPLTVADSGELSDIHHLTEAFATKPDVMYVGS